MTKSDEMEGRTIWIAPIHQNGYVEGVVISVGTVGITIALNEIEHNRRSYPWTSIEHVEWIEEPEESDV